MTGFSYPLLAREGYPHILIAGFAAVIGTMMWGLGAVPLWLIMLFVLQFFRDPKRTISEKPGAVVSPASGKVVAIGEEEKPKTAEVGESCAQLEEVDLRDQSAVLLHSRVLRFDFPLIECQDKS